LTKTKIGKAAAIRGHTPSLAPVLGGLQADLVAGETVAVTRAIILWKKKNIIDSTDKVEIKYSSG